MELIEEVASSHKQEISVAGKDTKGWIKVCEYINDQLHFMVSKTSNVACQIL